MAVQAVFRPGTVTARTSGISSEAIADAATFTGSGIDNATNRDMLLGAEMVWSYGSAPTASKTVKLHLIYSQDGTNYEEVNASNQIGAFTPSADTDTHRKMLIRDLSLLPKSFKLASENTDTGQTITLTVNAFTYNEQSEDA